MIPLLLRPKPKASNQLSVDQMRDFRWALEKLSPEQAGFRLLSVSLVASFLRSNHEARIPFPDKYLHGWSATDTFESREQLRTYILDLQCFNEKASSSGAAGTTAAAGFPILIYSLHAVMGSEATLEEGRRIWKELVRGVASFKELCRVRVNDSATKAQIAGELFMPCMLVPDWPLYLSALQSAPPSAHKCRVCGEEMHVLHVTPEGGLLPSLQVLECMACGDILTLTNPRRKVSVAPVA